ncbi:MAG TPA: 6-phosphogluconolactonase [Thermoleophilaceae bacterium]|nr:6-phosphogluconolactonase [Thermoleophilaceae bacterium]
MRPQVRVLDDPAAAAADVLIDAAAGAGQIALAGGSTPRAAYLRAAGAEVDWSRAVLWFGDDRCVPPDHEHSNYRMVRESLLDRLAGEPPVVRRIEGELGPGEAAERYEAELRAAFGAGLPELDLVLLGIGPDAHTASLFPGDAALDERERLAVGVETPGMAPIVPRVTLTLPVLNGARRVVFLVEGEDKAEAVARAFDGRPDPGAPASLVQPESGALELLVDPAAASALEPGQ